MLTVTEYEGDVGEGTVECDATECRTTLTIRPLGRNYSEVQVKWGSGGFTNLQLLAWDKREKPCADYVKGNDDRKTFDQLVAEYTGQPLQDWVAFVAEDNPDCKMPQFRKQVRIRKPRVKLPPPPIEEPAPAKKKPRKIPKHIKQFKCYDCGQPTVASKAVPCDDGVDVCRLCAGMRWAEADRVDEPEEVVRKVKPADFKWYTLSVSPNQERKVRRAIERFAKEQGTKQFIKRILIPTNKEIRIIEGSRLVRNRKTFSGYVLVQMVYCEETDKFFDQPKMKREGCWGLLPVRKRIVAPFGTKGYFDQKDDFVNWGPKEVSAEDMALILLRSSKASAMPRNIKLDYKAGDDVLVTDGDYADTVAKVVKVAGEKHDPVVTLTITLLGRPIEIEVPYDHCEKMSAQIAKRFAKTFVAKS